MTKPEAENLQTDLLALLVSDYGYNVSVGLKRDEAGWGVSVTSRQPDISMTNGGPVSVFQ